MNEKKAQKLSIKVYLVGLLVAIVVGCFYKGIAIPLGFTLGYFINHIVFFLIIKMSDAILQSQQSVLFVIMAYIAKLIVYALGFFIAIKLPNVFNLFAVFVGYFVIQTAIKIGRLFGRED